MCALSKIFTKHANIIAFITPRPANVYKKLRNEKSVVSQNKRSIKMEFYVNLQKNR